MTLLNIQKKIVETVLGSRRSYYYDATSSREYRRIVGGVAWPSGEKPGFFCVIGENENINPRLRVRNCWILTGYENKNIDKLIKRMYDIQNRYLVSPWYGNTTDQLMMHFVDRFNTRLSRKQKGIYLADVPFCGEAHNLKLYANQIQSRTVSTAKSLIFGGNTQIPGQLSALTPDDVQNKKAEDFPVVAALGYALSGLEEPYIDTSRDRELHEQFMVQRCVEGL